MPASQGDGWGSGDGGGGRSWSGAARDWKGRAAGHTELEPGLWAAINTWLRNLDFNPKATGSHKVFPEGDKLKVLLIKDMGMVDRFSGARFSSLNLGDKVLGRTSDQNK